MPSPDLSLFGFLKKAEAENYLRRYCKLRPGADPVEMWREAQTRLGARFPTPGFPEIKELPKGHAKYLRGVEKNRRFDDTIKDLTNWSFKLVEIEPLLAYQLAVFGDRSDSLCRNVTRGNPTIQQLLEVCLPHSVDQIRVTRTETADTLTLQADTLNFRLFGAACGDDVDKRTIMGAEIGTSSPLVQVLRFNGRCYLTNGFHRVTGLRRRGATHVPCIFADVSDYARTGGAQGGVLPLTLLEARNAPTLGHFSQNRATEVELRRLGRAISVQWSWSVVELP